MDRFRILVEPLDTLSLADRASALVRARELGRAAAELARDTRELEEAPVDLYLRHVIAPAGDAGAADPEAASAWQQACSAGRALRDPRVQAFLFGWHERATEILARIAADPDDSGVRARWFLDAIEALPHKPGGASD